MRESRGSIDRVAEAPLPRSTRNALLAAGIETLEQLVRRTRSDLLSLPRVAQVSLRQIERWLASEGRSLTPPREGPCPSRWVEQVLAEGRVPFNDRHERILRMRHGVGDGEPATMRHIGQQMGVSWQRVAQLLHEAEARVINHMIHERGEPGLPKPKTTVTRHCDTCGQPFERPRTSERRYCGAECRRTAHSSKMRRPDSPYSRCGYVTLRCDGCGQVFQRTRYQDQIRRRGAAARGIENPRTYCSRQCYRRYGIGRRRKHRGPAADGGDGLGARPDGRRHAPAAEQPLAERQPAASS